MSFASYLIKRPIRKEFNRKIIFPILYIILLNNIIFANSNTLETSLSYYYFDFKEDLDPPFKSAEKGLINGYNLSYIHENSFIPVYFRFLLKYTDAETDYDGSDQYGTSVKSVTDNIFIIVQCVFGYTFNKYRRIKINFTPYTGLGYHYWNRKTRSPNPYSENYSWKYIPIGLRTCYYFNKKINIELNISVKIMFMGIVGVNFKDIDDKFDNVDLSLGNKPGFRIQSPFNYLFSTRWFLCLSPFYEYSAIGKSNTETINFDGKPFWDVYEPSSRTHQSGVDAGIVWLF